jgi:hypothetical protein
MRKSIRQNHDLPNRLKRIPFHRPFFWPEIPLPLVPATQLLQPGARSLSLYRSPTTTPAAREPTKLL